MCKFFPLETRESTRKESRIFEKMTTENFSWQAENPKDDEWEANISMRDVHIQLVDKSGKIDFIAEDSLQQNQNLWTKTNNPDSKFVYFAIPKVAAITETSTTF